MTELTTLYKKLFETNRLFRKSKNWFDEDLLKVMKEKDKLFKKYIAKKTVIAKAKYKEAKNKYFHSIQEKKEAFYASILEKQKHNLKKHDRLLTFF